MEYTAIVITISDKGSKGERVDTAGPTCEKILKDNNWQVIRRDIIPDEYEIICKQLCRYADEDRVKLVVTTGGTGFSKRDVSPEATINVCQRMVRGIPEAMRAKSMEITPMAMLSRAEAGIRGNTLIVNLPGSEKAAKECLEAVIKPIKHGVEVLAGESLDCATMHKA